MAVIYQFPVELIERIAIHIESDDDMLSFALTCRGVANCILSSTSGVWRARFNDKYDAGWKYTSDTLHVEYQMRAMVLGQPVYIQPNETIREQVWLEVISTLLTETYVTKRGEPRSPRSKNLLRIAEAVKKTNFLNRPMVRDHNGQMNPSDDYCAVQLCLSHLCFDPNGPGPCLRSNYDITEVYSWGQEAHESLVEDGQIRLDTLLHIRNFWQRHLLSTREQSFATSYEENVQRKPREWLRPLEDPIPVMGYWHGYYSCIHPYPTDVDTLMEWQTCASHESEHDATLMSLILIDANRTIWPKRFDDQFPEHDLLCPRKYFIGSEGFEGDDSLHYHIRGFYQDIPETQGGIYGWMRVCFVSYLLSEERDGQDEPDTTSWETYDIYNDFDRIYGFEGILLPGGKILLGKYFDLQFEGEEDCERGPCIYWEHTSMGNILDILTISQSIKDPFLTCFSPPREERA